jgi:HK97 family phage portal protein
MNVIARMITSVRNYVGSWGAGDKALASLFGRGPTIAGVNVTEMTALNISAVWAAVQLIAGNVGSLPLMHYRRKGERPSDREQATDTKLYRLLHDEPNSEMAASTFFETLQTHVLLWGNAFAEILRDGSGRIASLYPIEPWRVSAVRQNGLAGELLYRIAQRDGKDALLTTSEILHVPGLTTNGVWGISVLRHARESLGLTMATEQFSASFFGKGSTASGILSHPGTLTPAQEGTLRTSLEGRHQGVERAHQFIILQGGMKFEQLSMSARDSQFLQQRQFQLSEVARWFNVPPHMIGDVTNSTTWGSGIQSQTLGFLQFCLRRWLVKWEKELNRKLISPLERNLQFIEFVLDGLERGDQDSRYQAYAIGRQWGWLSVNDVRAYENLSRIDGGDLYLVPVNMTTPEKLEAAEPPAAPVAPGPAKPAPDAEPEDDDEDEADDERMREFKEDLEKLMELGRRALDKPDPAPLDLAPIFDQLAVLQKELILTVTERNAQETADVIRGVREAQTALEARIAELPKPEPVDLAPLAERLDSANETKRTADAAFSEMLEATRAALEEKIAQIPQPEPVDLAPVVREIQERGQEMLGPIGELQSQQAALAELRAASEARIEAAQTELRERLDASEAARKEQAERLAGLTPTLRDVIEDAVRKVVRVEADRVRKAAQTPEKLRAWMETFYATREDVCLGHLLPAMRLHFQLVGRPDAAEAETRRIIHEHVESSRAALETLAGDAETLEANVKALTAHWEAERPKAIADECLREVIAHV